VIANDWRRNRGITVFEVLLVLVIGASLLLITIRQFQSYRVDADVQQLKYNVDTIFQAMARYYKVNCYGRVDPDNAGTAYNPPGQIEPGTLNPNHPDVTNPFPVNIQTDLIDKRFLISNLPTGLPLNPLVDYSDGNLGGYVAQFNESILDRYVCETTNGNVSVNTPYDTNCTSKKQMGTIVIWRAQVAVKLNDPDTTDQYLRLLNGDCLSDYDAGTQTVAPCQGFPGSGSYVVWERLPSFASPDLQTDYWLQNPTVQQFTQMYQTYPMVYLITPPNEGNIPGGQPQYIYCGS